MVETPIDDLLVIDWYDGPVTAVCTLDTGKTVLVLLLAVDLDSDERIYGLVPITPDDAATLRSMVGESGRPLDEDARANLDRTLRRLTDGHAEMVVVLGNLREGPMKASTSVPLEIHRSWVGYTIDEAVEPRRLSHWRAALVATFN